MAKQTSIHFLGLNLFQIVQCEKAVKEIDDKKPKKMTKKELKKICKDQEIKELLRRADVFVKVHCAPRKEIEKVW